MGYSVPISRRLIAALCPPDDPTADPWRCGTPRRSELCAHQLNFPPEAVQLVGPDPGGRGELTCSRHECHRRLAFRGADLNPTVPWVLEGWKRVGSCPFGQAAGTRGRGVSETLCGAHSFVLFIGIVNARRHRGVGFVFLDWIG